MKTLEIVAFKDAVFTEIVARSQSWDANQKINAFELQSLTCLCMVHKAAVDALQDIPDSLDVRGLCQTVESVKMFVRGSEGEGYTDAYIFDHLRKLLDMPKAAGGAS